MIGGVVDSTGRTLRWEMARRKGLRPANYKGRAKIGGGYIGIYLPGHPRAKPNGYVPEHILIVEKAIGKPLRKDAVVHHINRNRADNRNENLVVCHGAAYHMHIHMRIRALESCGHANWLVCKYCGKYDDPRNLMLRGKNKEPVHRECSRLYGLNWRNKNREKYNQWAADRRARSREILRKRARDYYWRKKKESCGT